MTRLREFVQFCSLCLVFCLSVLGQSTQGLISGRVLDSEEGAGVANAEVGYLSLATNTGGSVRTDASGRYVVPLLPPGKYRLRVTRERYQAQELHELELPVASSLEVNFTLRPLSDVWEEGQYKSLFLPGTRSVLTFYGPDVDSTHVALLSGDTSRLSPLETSVSTIVDPVDIRELPLAARDVYATLVLQPGVTADTSTARGLGLSINGQRPSSSNYLLDGVENNNYLVTGPFAVVPPEAIQEYRVSINNFSAEYGRTSGFIANAVTRAGGGDWHGVSYFDLKNDALNANTFQQNSEGSPRTPLKEDEAGFQVGGPFRKRSLFTSTAFDYVRSRSFQQSFKVALPTTDFLTSDLMTSTPDSIANMLLKRYRPPSATAAGGCAVGPTGNIFSAICPFSPPASVDRYTGLERIDYVSPKGLHHVMGRLALGRISNPDFIWTPYTDFISGLDDYTDALTVAWTSSVDSHLTNELRGSWSTDNIQWNRRHPEIPTMFAQGILLPGSPAFYAYKNHGRNWELLDNLVWSAGRHIVKSGAGVLLRELDGYLTAGRDGKLWFLDLSDFAMDEPNKLDVSTKRQNPAIYQAPDFRHRYRYGQYFLFVQDSFKASSRLALNYGVRYENFSAPRDASVTKDALLALGPGASFPERLVSATLPPPPTSGDHTLYQSDNKDLSPRFGFAYSLRRDSRTLFRGAYGIFYDRSFDNLWQTLGNNNFVLEHASLPNAQPINYLTPFSSLLAGVQLQPSNPNYPLLTMYQPGIQNGYAQSYFLGLQHQATSNLTLEIDSAGSLGRKLITTDRVNRNYSVPVTPTSFEQNPLGYYNPALGEISYRGTQGISDYNAMTVLVRYRGRRSQFQTAYTWSHAIDNQSDPLLNDLFDLSFTTIGAGNGTIQIPSFARQFDSRADRANSDFDQRQSLVFYSLWELPAVFTNTKAAPVFRGWRISQLGAIRSGFPFTVTACGGVAQVGQVLAPNGGGMLEPTHASLLDPREATSYVAVSGGVRLLNPNAFQNPPDGQQGNTGRNEFRGPGLYSIDLSLSRALELKWLREGVRLTFRADAFNILNHANLNNPAFASIGSSSFGVAYFGRLDRSPNFPALTPFNETARQIQILLRIEF